jgi:hypothetical protein
VPKCFTSPKAAVAQVADSSPVRICGLSSSQPIGYYAEAQQVADVFGVPVGIYPTRCDDGRFRHWDWQAAGPNGLLPGYVDVVYPTK